MKLSYENEGKRVNASGLHWRPPSFAQWEIYITILNLIGYWATYCIKRARKAHYLSNNRF